MFDLLTVTTSVVVLVGIGCAIAGYAVARIAAHAREGDGFADRRSGSDARLLDLVLTNMSQGLCVFDGSKRLVVCNDQYREMYGLSPELVRPGTELLKILEFRASKGDYTGPDPRAYIAEIYASLDRNESKSGVLKLKTGRILHTARKPLDGGGWVATHEDITERQVAEQQRIVLAEQEKRRNAVENAIASFRESLDGVLGSVGGGVDQLRSTAKILLLSSNDTSRRATSAVHAAHNTSENMSAAATSADELLISIGEISRQLRAAADLVQIAFSEARSMNDEIAGLTEATHQIGKIVQAIRAIAGQTNLLALNATIEAARAGQAGMGFSVVASEVKSLAVQTTKATEEIIAQITAVQSAAATTVDAIQNNSKRMQEINRYTEAISASIEEQNAATNEITGNVKNASEDTSKVVGVLAEVDGAAAKTRSSAQTVLTASESVEAAASRLREKVKRFLDEVAA